jgi:transposase-like protein
MLPYPPRPQQRPEREVRVVVVADVACTSPKCPQRGVKGAGNVILRRTYGPDAIRFLNCRLCKAQFSERRGTPLFDLRLPKAEIIDVVKHLAEGIGGRKTARLTGVSRDSVGRIMKLVGKHAKAIHDELVRDLDVPEVQMDEMWSFVGKKRQASQRRGKGLRRTGKHLGSRRA